MGYNVAKPPFNLAEFLSQKATRRVTKRRFTANIRLGSQAVAEADATQYPENDQPPAAPKE